MDFKNIVRELPTTSGVYFFKKGDTILYIGKAVNIKARVAGHIQNAKIDNKEAQIVGESDVIDFTITDSEFKALLLESHLIQKHKPKYNSRWKDDKSYLYIKITVSEEFPKIYPVRKEADGSSMYIGPFSSNREVELIVKELRRVFPFCTQKRISKQRCFYAKIGQCGPCPNEIAHTEDKDLKAKLKRQYRNNVRNVIKTLEGKSDEVLKGLYRELKKLTKEKKYEEAIVVRNRIFKLERLLQQRIMSQDITTTYNQSEESMRKLISILVPYFPDVKKLERIECFDVSNLSQKEATASLVVAENGLMERSQYKRFKIRGEWRSDFEMMEEVLTRRFKQSWEKPDLIVVDGGRPQVRVALQTAYKMGIFIPIIGIAKRPDRIVIGKDLLPTVRPPMNHLGFNLVRLLRDESHRFAKKYHTLLRRKKFFDATKAVPTSPST